MADKIIVLTGLDETLSALEAFDKQAVKAFNKVINTELGKAKDNARALVPRETPMSGWKTTDPIKPRKSTRGGMGWPAWDYSSIAGGIVSTKAQGRVSRNYKTNAGALKNTYSAGAIFEVAGRKTSGNGTGVKFIENLNKRFGKASRLIWNVVDKDGDNIRKNVAQALEDAKKRLQAELNKQRS